MPGHRLEQFRRHVAAGADRRGADVELAGLLLRERDDVRDRLRRKRRMREQHHRHRGDQPDGGEILARIVAGIGIEARVDRDACRCGRAAACSRRARPSAPRACRPARRRRRDCRPPPAGRAPRTFAPPRRAPCVDTAAGRIGHDQRDGAGRIVLGGAAARRRAQTEASEHQPDDRDIVHSTFAPDTFTTFDHFVSSRSISAA